MPGRSTNAPRHAPLHTLMLLQKPLWEGRLGWSLVEIHKRQNVPDSLGSTTLGAPTTRAPAFVFVKQWTYTQLRLAALQLIHSNCRARCFWRDTAIIV